MRNIHTFIGVIWGNIYLFLKSIIHPGRIKYSWTSVFSFFAKVIIRKQGRISLGNKVFIRDHVTLDSSGELKVGSTCEIKQYSSLQANGGKLTIHDDVFINSGCLFVCCDSIEIEGGTMFGSNVSIYDHDHVFKGNGKQNSELQKTSPVHIGRNCWIGANTIILRGTSIGDNCLIAAGSIIKGDIPSGTKVIQKRHTEIILLEKE